jgi:PAS domain-containing protein
VNPQRGNNLIRQVGALFRLSAQIVGGLGDEWDSSIAKARRPTPTQRQKEFFKAVVQNSQTAIVMLDLDQRIASCNPAFETLFGYS